MTVWYSLKWRRYGTDSIKLSSDKILIVEKTPFKKFTYTYNLRDIRISENDIKISLYKDIFEVHPGTIKIESRHGVRYTTFGRYLSAEETNMILHELKTLGFDCIIRNTPLIEPAIAEENISKRTIKIMRIKSFLICLIPAFLLSYPNFKNNLEEYNLLKNHGEITNVVSEFKENWDTDYCRYYFITHQGQKIERSEKCGDRENYENNYKHFKVIYNPAEPGEYMKYPDFIRFSINSEIISLIISTLFFAAIASSFIMFGYLAIKGHIKLTS